MHEHTHTNPAYISSFWVTLTLTNIFSFFPLAQDDPTPPLRLLPGRKRRLRGSESVLEPRSTCARLKVLKVLCSYYVTAICKFALLMYMSEFCCYVMLNF